MRVPVLFILIKFGIFSLHFSHSGGCVVPHFLCLYSLMVLMSIFSCAHSSFSYTFLWSVASSHLTTYTGLSSFSLLISLLCFAIFIFGKGVFLGF
jgi:hypothetical protein